ncbi:hypothetical protein BJY04DRAFT_212697 [Aspergillus karnatakaensis]|uniref:Zn(II)2Cys6 transcription factor domain-containing protein n=1 Tax=Aspergillus karnatakaensis TaxID=1810916 RepID=UPI003CCDC4FE
MDSSSYTNSKRPPKLRSACNECHAAKVRCTGEKTGCQRCSNLRLKCAFSISRIGKVPGKRSKANRVAAGTTVASSAPVSTSSSSITTPAMSPPMPTAPYPYETTRSYDGRNNVAVCPTSYPFTPEYPTTTAPVSSEANYHHYPSSYHSQANPEDLSNLSNICWTTELDQLGGPGLLSPEWELDAEDAMPPQPSHTAPVSIPTYPDPGSNTKQVSRAYASPPEPYPSIQYTMYLDLLHNIDHTIQFSAHFKSPSNEAMQSSALDAILTACQRFLTTLLHIADSQVFVQTYNEDHLLFSVALDKVVYLFSLAYTDFRQRMELYEGMGANYTGSVDRWIRLGGYDVDIVEQMAFYSKAFVEEVKRARVCLGRLMEAMGYASMSVSVSSSPGRHERLCEEMKGRLDRLMDDLEADQSAHGVRMVG